MKISVYEPREMVLVEKTENSGERAEEEKEQGNGSSKEEAICSIKEQPNCKESRATEKNRRSASKNMQTAAVDRE